MRMLLGFMPSREPFPAAAILQEHEDDRGLLLWMSLRAVDLWIGADSAIRGSLFREDADQRRLACIDALPEQDAALADALRGVAGVLMGPPADAPTIASACAALAHWANAGGWPRTAFEAAARAALTDPRNPAHALLAGKMATQAAEYSRAAAWLARAIRLARRGGDGGCLAHALLAMAQIHMARGQREPAEAVLHQAIRAARRYGAWEVKPRAYHDLFCIQCTDGDVKTAAACALTAAEGYGLHHRLLPALAHDLSLFLSSQGRGSQVLPLMEELAPRMSTFPLRLVAFSSLGRVAGAAGDRARFAAAWSVVWGAIDLRVSEARAAEAMINLAWGAAHLRDTQRVEVAAREALRIATPRQEWQEVRAASEMLAELERGAFPESPPTAAGSDEDLHDALSAAEILLQQLLRTPALRDLSGRPG
jgi:tetratricopeptide (TPR) repeat protein